MLTSSDFFLGGAACNKWDAAVKFYWGFFHDVWNQPLEIGYVPVCCCQALHQVKSFKWVCLKNTGKRKSEIDWFIIIFPRQKYVGDCGGIRYTSVYPIFRQPTWYQCRPWPSHLALSYFTGSGYMDPLFSYTSSAKPMMLLHFFFK